MQDTTNTNIYLEYRYLDNLEFISTPFVDSNLTDIVFIYNDGQVWKIVPLEIVKYYPVIHDKYYEIIDKKVSNISQQKPSSDFIIFKELIDEYNILKTYILPNKNFPISIIDNKNKEETSKKIINLATKIYEHAKIITDYNKIKQLTEILNDLYNKYNVIFIEPHIQPGQRISNIEGINNNKIISKNLKKKFNNLNKKN